MSRPEFDLLLKNVRVVRPNGNAVHEADIAVNAGRIARVAPGIDAARAKEIGLVSRVVPPAQLLATAEQIAERIGQNGPIAIKITKELAWRSLHQHPDDALRFYGAVTALIHETEDSKEGPRAFAEKRTPRFKGK